MGKLLILAKYIFLVYGTDIYEKRKHIHVTWSRRGFKRSCKFWIEPEIKLDEKKKGDFSDTEINEIEKIILQKKDIILKQLDLFHSNKPVKAIRL